MPEWPAFEIQSVKVKHMLWPHSVAGSPGGGVTSAIDPDFKRNRLPAGSVVRGQRLAVVWTHISLSQLSSTQRAPDAVVLKDIRSLIIVLQNVGLSVQQALTVQIFNTVLPFHLV